MDVQSLVRRERLPYSILFIALLVTAATARYAHTEGARKDLLEFEKAVENVRGTLSSRVDAYVAMLLGGAGLFAASAEVTRDEFRAYVGRLELPRRYPGTQGIGFSRVIHPHEREQIYAVRRRDVPTFRFWPEPRTDTFSAIVYLEPLDRRNQYALGFDMTSETTRNEAMMRSRDEGVPVASGRVTLVQEEAGPGPHQAGVLIYVPVYEGGGVPDTPEARREQHFGHVYSPLRADDLLHNVIGPEMRSALQIEVFDQVADDAHLLHRSEAGQASAPFVVERTLNVAGRDWIVRVRGGDRGQATLLVVAPIGLGGIVLSFLVFMSMRNQISARIAAERAAEELRVSEEKLRLVDREKDAFLAIISHELRTPLNAIVGWASMLGRGVVPQHTQAHAIDVIKRNAAAQTRLIEDLLDMSRAVAGHLSLRFTDVDVNATLEAAVDALKPSAEAAGLKVETQISPRLGVIEADAGRVHQIVTNLLTNSIKFSPRGGQITITAERSAGTILIAVADTGIGIKSEFLPFLFDRFKQADSSTTRAHSGAGLGLAIVRHLVQLHGGTIEAASAGHNRGAAFTVRLPTNRKRKLA
jgi:two-component system, OmpR family, sensor kinase